MTHAYHQFILISEMAIRGIRSFDEKEPNIIQFYNPLTLIVGTNGSGKTVSKPQGIELLR